MIKSPIKEYNLSLEKTPSKELYAQESFEPEKSKGGRVPEETFDPEASKGGGVPYSQVIKLVEDAFSGASSKDPTSLSALNLRLEDNKVTHFIKSINEAIDNNSCEDSIASLEKFEEFKNEECENLKNTLIRIFKDEKETVDSLVNMLDNEHQLSRRIFRAIIIILGCLALEVIWLYFIKWLF